MKAFHLVSLTAAVALCPGFVLAHPHGHPADPGHTHAVPVRANSSQPSTQSMNDPIVSGSGKFKFQYDPSRLKLPPEVKMKHGHGLCHDKQGNIYFTFEPEQVGDDTRVLVRFKPDGSEPVLLGKNNALAHGVPHGLKIHVEPSGQEVLYHANNHATVHKTTLDGSVLWSRAWGPEMGNYKPTDTTVAPSGDRLFVADGYGSSMIHVFRTTDGVYAGKSWGGIGASHGELNCPHGIIYDTRRQLLLAADRTNKRLEYFELNGKYHSTVSVPEIQAPCNADVQGDFLLVPNLDGPLVILDKNNETVSVIEVGKLLGDQGFKHPHQAIWLPNGDIVVCTWNPGRIGYWKRLALIAR